MTMKGGASSYEKPSIVTCRSCMHSRSADCVFGEARLISSTRRRFAKTGPGRNSNSFCAWLKTFTPVTSEGSRSGVNWRREKETSSERASAFASVVFPTPGKSSMIRWPSATRQSTTSRSVSSGAWTTRCRFSTTDAIVRWASPTATERLPTASIGLLQQAGDLVEDRAGDHPLRGLLDPSFSVPADQRHLVLLRVETDVTPCYVIEDDEVHLLVSEL